jgi:hypothetical protein
MQLEYTEISALMVARQYIRYELPRHCVFYADR